MSKYSQEQLDFIEANQERKRLRDLRSNKPLQYKSALARQKQLGYDSNYMALISGIISACAIGGVDIPPLAQKAKDDVDSIWVEKYRRVSEEDLNLDYSAFGLFPVTYTELRTESEA